MTYTYNFISVLSVKFRFFCHFLFWVFVEKVSDDFLVIRVLRNWKYAALPGLLFEWSS